MNNVLKSNLVQRQSQLKVYDIYATAPLLYGCEIWTLRKLKTTEIKFMRETAWYSLWDHRRDDNISEELNLYCPDLTPTSRGRCCTTCVQVLHWGTYGWPIWIVTHMWLKYAKGWSRPCWNEISMIETKIVKLCEQGGRQWISK